jgi:MFS family permease
MGINTSVSINFFKEELDMVGLQMGYYTAARETAGFLLVVFAALTARFRATRMAAFALFVTGVGYGSYALVGSFEQLVMVAIIGSIGFHSFTQLYYLLALGLAESGFEGRVLGRLQSVGSAGMLAAMLLALALVVSVGYRTIFVISGVAVALGGLALLFVPANPRMVRQQGFVLRRRYWLYYALNFFDGCRFEIFTTFAVFALVDVYGVHVQTIVLLLIANSVLTWIAAPILGAWIDRVGERRVLTTSYAGHVVVFLGFAVFQNVYLLFAAYLGYRVLDVARLSLNTYLKKVCAPQDLSPSLAMGVTMNHAAAVVIPITGGVLWQTFGYQVSFLFGAFFVVVSIALTQLIRGRVAVPAVEPAV